MENTRINGKIVVLPYWLVDCLKAHNKPASTLKNYGELRTIITGTDLDFYIRNQPSLEHGLGEDQPTLTAIGQTLYEIMPSRLFSTGKPDEFDFGSTSQDTLMSNKFSQWVRPTFDGLLHDEYRYQFEAVVICDAFLETDGPVIGIVVKSATRDNDTEGEISCLSTFIQLLTKYYGIERIATTPIMARYIKLKDKGFKN